jgi:hypothetical protein
MRITIVEFVINPPPLADLSFCRKMGRVLCVATLLIMGCIAGAFVLAIFLEAYQRL